MGALTLSTPIRLLIVDDHAVVRAGLKAVLGSAKDIQVIGEGSTGKDAISLAERLDPDVIVMDLSMGEMDGAEATKELVGKKTRGKVLILTMHAEDAYLVPLLEAGAFSPCTRPAPGVRRRSFGHFGSGVDSSQAPPLAGRATVRAERASVTSRWSICSCSREYWRCTSTKQLERPKSATS